jgi:hypothetical protein
MVIVAQFEQDGCGHAYRRRNGRTDVGFAARHRRDGSPRLVFDTTVVLSHIRQLDFDHVIRRRVDYLVFREERVKSVFILGRDEWSDFRSPFQSGSDDSLRELPELGASTFDWERGIARVFDWWVILQTTTATGQHGKLNAMVTGALGLAVVPGGGCYFNTHGVETCGLGEVVIDDKNGHTCFFPAHRPLSKYV